MKTKLVFLLALVAVSLFTACGKIADPGDYREGTESYSLNGFTKIQMGSAFKVNVLQGSAFSISARGDVRNLDDLYVRVENGVLIADYRPWNLNRRHNTEFTIVMPALEGVDFSGAVTSVITGFSGSAFLDVRLSGASISTINVQTTQCYSNLSGASKLTISGSATSHTSELSGASILESFGFGTTNCNINASGASTGKLNVSNTLNVQASGASQVRYVGSPSVVSNLSGGSSLTKE